MSALRAARHVGVERLDGIVYVAPLPAGPILVLEGSAAAIWDAIDGRAADAVVREVADAAGVDQDFVRVDVERFLADLIAQGLVEEV